MRLARWVISVKMTREESIEFYKAYSRKLFNVSFRIVGDSALAEEIMQDTVLKFFRFVGEGERADRDGDVGDSSLALRMTEEPLRMTGEPLRMTGDMAGRKATEAWLVRTCVRGSIDALRRLKREREFLGEYETWQESAAEVGQENPGGEGRISVEEVKKAMGALPPPYRLILTLVLIDGLDYEEISEITGEKEGALRTRFSRARKMLAKRLKEGR